jgi:hypothetical protein
MILPDARSLPHGLAHWVVWRSSQPRVVRVDHYAPNRHDTGSTTARSVDEVALIRDTVSHYAPVVDRTKFVAPASRRAQIFSTSANAWRMLNEVLSLFLTKTSLFFTKTPPFPRTKAVRTQAIISNSNSEMKSWRVLPLVSGNRNFRWSLTVPPPNLSALSMESSFESRVRARLTT